MNADDKTLCVATRENDQMFVCPKCGWADHTAQREHGFWEHGTTEDGEHWLMMCTWCNGITPENELLPLRMQRLGCRRLSIDESEADDAV